MNFSSQNGAIWCILGVLFLRFMCPEKHSDLRYSEVPLKGKKYNACQNFGGVVKIGRPLQVKYWGGHDPCNIDAYVLDVLSKS